MQGPMTRGTIVTPIWSSTSDVKAFEVEPALEGDHPEYYLDQKCQERMANDASLSDHDKMIIQRLACRKFHIPGNDFWEDYAFW
jgi:hypothetical protein